MRSSPFTAVYDACVLYPAPLRDLLLWLAVSGSFRARWSEQIQAEWTRSLLTKRPELASALERTVELMNHAVPDALVTGHEALITGLELPDPDDRHVLAAAIRCGAGVIVTFNLKDFPQACLDPFSIEAQHPDEFIDNLMALDASVVVKAAQRARANLRSPPYNVEQYLDVLARQGLLQTTKDLRSFAGVL